jgi:hypothetical protein
MTHNHLFSITACILLCWVSQSRHFTRSVILQKAILLNVVAFCWMAICSILDGILLNVILLNVVAPSWLSFHSMSFCSILSVILFKNILLKLNSAECHSAKCSGSILTLILFFGILLHIEWHFAEFYATNCSVSILSICGL